MSIKINVDDLSETQRIKIDKELVIKIEPGKYGGGFKYIYPYEVVGNTVILPFAFAARELKVKRPDRTESSKTELLFEGVLREQQIEVKKEAIEILKTGSVIISSNPGFGKTIISISLACSIKLKCLVVVNKLVLMKQWKDSIYQFCPKAIVQLLTPKSDIDDKADFYVMNAVNIPKMGREFFKNIKLLIVDEVHLIMAEKLSVLMKYIFPRYLIGLSATPYRTDGLDILLDLYYGKTKIVREMNQKHLVYKVQTEFKPKVEYTEAGKLNWSSILDSQAEDEKRNQLILNILQKFKDRIFLVLVKRVKHGRYLVDQLLERGESVTSLLGSNQEFDKEARILVATSQKAGCGFDHARLDALLLPTDFENFYIQILARVFRRRDVEPIVFDIVDDHPILFKHYKSRREICINAGGKIKMFFKDFPDLKIKY
jgi:superfamily II DNA or RNA helicase